MATTKPRRRPRRRTSAEIVEAILDAAEEALVTDGLAAMTTNKVATRAGVSVGSLYQYFPNKQAVVAGVTGRLNKLLVAAIREALRGDAGPRARVIAAVEAYCNFEFVPLRRAILVDVPRAWDEAGIERAEEAVRDLISDIAPTFTTLDADDAFKRLVSIAFAARGAIQGALLMHIPMVELRSRLVEMVCTWLPEDRE